jgi:hypothetical protein
MRDWFGRHWRALLGGSALSLPVLQGIRSLLSVVSDVDFVVSKASDPGWLGVVWSFLMNVPVYVYLPLIGIGLALIWLDTRGARSASGSSGREIAVTDRETAEAFLALFARENDLGRPLPGSRDREFDLYAASYNDYGGTVAFAVRQDDLRSPPYFYGDQNDRYRGARYGGERRELPSVSFPTSSKLSQSPRRALFFALVAFRASEISLCSSFWRSRVNTKSSRLGRGFRSSVGSAGPYDIPRAACRFIGRSLRFLAICHLEMVGRGHHRNYLRFRAPMHPSV